jgi:hypothetical protein
MNQMDKATRFRALHEAAAPFVLGNAWDAGSARVLAGAGFVALATSSGATAGVLGRRDGAVSRDEAMASAKAIAGACDLPVSGDLENGYGHDAQTVVETIGRAAQAGLVGGSIEDYSGDTAQPLYPLAQAVQRVEAAVQAARALPWPFTLTARCENFLRGNPNLDDTIARLQAFERGCRRVDGTRSAGSRCGAPVRGLCANRSISWSAFAANRSRWPSCRGGCQTHQPRDLAVPQRDDGAVRGRPRGTQRWHLRVSRAHDVDCGLQRLMQVDAMRVRQARASRGFPVRRAALVVAVTWAGPGAATPPFTQPQDDGR